MRHAGLFGLSDQLKRLSDCGDPLKTIGWVVDFRVFRPTLEKALVYADGSKAARKAFDSCVRWRLRIRRTRCSIVGRVAASQIASASAALFLARLTYGFTYCAGMSFTSCPSATRVRMLYSATMRRLRCQSSRRQLREEL